MQYKTLEVASNFTKIPNEVLEMLPTINMNWRYWRMLMFLIRHLYGYRKAESTFDASYIAKKTNLSLDEIEGLLGGLAVAKITRFEVIDVSKCSNGAPYDKKYLVSVNINYSEWLLDDLGLIKTTKR